VLDDIEELFTGAIDLPGDEASHKAKGRRAVEVDPTEVSDHFLTRVLNIWYLRTAGLLIFVGFGIIQNLSGAIKNSSRDMTGFWWQFGIMAVVLGASAWLEPRLLAAVQLPFSGRKLEEHVQEALERAEGQKTLMQIRAERSAGPIYFISVAVALAVTGISLIVGSASITDNVMRFTAVLLVVSPAAFSLAVGIISQTVLGRLAGAGTLVKNRAAFEQLADIDLVVFDKSGTLTTDERTFVSALLAHGSSLHSTEDLITIAAAVEGPSQHSLGKAIVAEAARRGLDVPNIIDFRTIPGQGVTGLLENTTIILGGPVLLTSRNIEIDVTDLVRADTANQNGNTVLFLVREGELLGTIEIADVVRPTAKKAVFGLQLLRKRVAILTADATGVAGKLANELEVTEVLAEVLPHQKAAAIESLQADSSQVAMVGNAREDALALAASDVSIAIDATLEDLQTENDILVNGQDPIAVTNMVKLAVRAKKKTAQNIGVAFGVNVGGILLASGLLAPIGIVLPPVGAVILSCFASLFVINNARLLRR
jgi:Cu2+-exporting ATPase